MRPMNDLHVCLSSNLFWASQRQLLQSAKSSFMLLINLFHYRSRHLFAVSCLIRCSKSKEMAVNNKGWARNPVSSEHRSCVYMHCLTGRSRSYNNNNNANMPLMIWLTLSVESQDGHPVCKKKLTIAPLTKTITNQSPRVGSGIVRIDPLRFLAGCRTRRLNQV